MRRTARTVTQVSQQLDFEVVSCTEPFGAVKKLMGEHFDAVVVDCDNGAECYGCFLRGTQRPEQPIGSGGRGGRRAGGSSEGISDRVRTWF